MKINQRRMSKKKKELSFIYSGDFLEEVFMPEEDYDHLVDILQSKKNVILQGAPGVGKTFAAKGYLLYHGSKRY